MDTRKRSKQFLLQQTAIQQDLNYLLHKSGSSQSWVLKRLMEQGANHDSSNEEGNALAHQAADRGNWPAVMNLLSLGADVNSKDRNGNTLVHKAADQYDFEAVRNLIHAGADIETKDKDGISIFDIIWQNSLRTPHSHAVLFYLVEKGAKYTDKTEVHKFVISSYIMFPDFHAKSNPETIDKLLAELGDDLVVPEFCRFPQERIQTFFDDAVNHNRYDVLLRIYKHCPDFFNKNKISDFHLMIIFFKAIKSNFTALPMFLIEHNHVHVDMTDLSGSSALHHASRADDTDFVRFLVANGAETHNKNSELKKPIDYATKEEIVELLTTPAVTTLRC